MALTSRGVADSRSWRLGRWLGKAVALAELDPSLGPLLGPLLGAPDACPGTLNATVGRGEPGWIVTAGLPSPAPLRPSAWTSNQVPPAMTTAMPTRRAAPFLITSLTASERWSSTPRAYPVTDTSYSEDQRAAGGLSAASPRSGRRSGGRW